MKKGIKLSTAIFIFVIIILVIGLVWMYVYYNNQNNIGNTNTEISNKGNTDKKMNETVLNAYEKYSDLYWLFKGEGKTEYTWYDDKIEIKDGKLYVKGSVVDIEGTPKALVTWGEQTVQRIYVLTEEGTVWKTSVVEGTNERLNSNFEKINLPAKILDMADGGNRLGAKEPPYFLLETGELVNEEGNKYEDAIQDFATSFGNEGDRIYVKKDNTIVYYDRNNHKYITIKDEDGNDVKMKNAYVQWSSFDGELAKGATERLFVVTDDGKLLYFDGYNTATAKVYKKAKNKIVKNTREEKQEREYGVSRNRIIEFTDGTKLKLQDTTENLMED